MGCQVAVGTPIRIIRRVIAKHEVIQLNYCVVQYSGCLKTERYGIVQVVLLLPLTSPYQGFCFEGERKYGDRDISEGGSIFSRSKDERVGDGPLPSQSTDQNFLN